jgi:hypothetical protein
VVPTNEGPRRLQEKPRRSGAKVCHANSGREGPHPAEVYLESRLGAVYRALDSWRGFLGWVMGESARNCNQPCGFFGGSLCTRTKRLQVPQL